MPRPKTGHRPKSRLAEATPFGRFVVASGLTYEEIGPKLGIGNYYVGYLCRGKATPGLDLAIRIERWSGGKVPAASSWKGARWAESLRSLTA